MLVERVDSLYDWDWFKWLCFSRMLWCLSRGLMSVFYLFRFILHCVWEAKSLKSHLLLMVVFEGELISSAPQEGTVAEGMRYCGPTTASPSYRPRFSAHTTQAWAKLSFGVPSAVSHHWQRSVVPFVHQKKKKKRLVDWDIAHCTQSFFLAPMLPFHKHLFVCFLSKRIQN